MCCKYMSKHGLIACPGETNALIRLAINREVVNRDIDCLGICARINKYRVALGSCSDRGRYGSVSPQSAYSERTSWR
jgi:hypothetical protein